MSTQAEPQHPAPRRQERRDARAWERAERDARNGKADPAWVATIRPKEQGERRRRGRFWLRSRIMIATVLAALPLAACSATATAPAKAKAASAERAATPSVPDTAAAARSAATSFFALYSAGQWDAVWHLLAPDEQRLAPEGLYVAFHQQCPSQSAGMAYKIEGVVLAGKTAVVTYTIPVVEKVLGSATLAEQWTRGGWGAEFSPALAGHFTHGSLKADVAAAKAAGDCG